MDPECCMWKALRCYLMVINQPPPYGRRPNPPLNHFPPRHSASKNIHLILMISNLQAVLNIKPYMMQLKNTIMIIFSGAAEPETWETHPDHFLQESSSESL